MAGVLGLGSSLRELKERDAKKELAAVLKTAIRFVCLYSSGLFELEGRRCILAYILGCGQHGMEWNKVHK